MRFSETLARLQQQSANRLLIHSYQMTRIDPRQGFFNGVIFSIKAIGLRLYLPAVLSSESRGDSQSTGHHRLPS